MDNILIYFKDVEKYKQHLKQIFEILRENNLYAKLSKCALFTVLPSWEVPSMMIIWYVDVRG